MKLNISRFFQFHLAPVAPNVFVDARFTPREGHQHGAIGPECTGACHFCRVARTCVPAGTRAGNHGHWSESEQPYWLYARGSRWSRHDVLCGSGGRRRNRRSRGEKKKNIVVISFFSSIIMSCFYQTVYQNNFRIELLLERNKKKL